MLKKVAALYAFVIVLGLLTLGSAAKAAADDPSLSLKSSTSGTEVTITVTGEHLKDLYAYDLVLTFDMKKLSFKSASAGSTGFSVDPIVKNNEIRVAHTKVGKTVGDNGDLQLAVIKFTRQQSGASQVMLRDIKLVDSHLISAAIITKPVVTVEEQKDTGSAHLKDIEGHWAKDAINQAVQQGWVNGYPNATFLPNKEVTRAEFAAMVIRAIGTGEGSGQPLQFTDAKQIPSWAVSYVQDAAGRKLMNGYENGAFGPNRLITRAEMAAMAVRTLNAAEALNDFAELSFADSKQIPAWAKPYAAAAAQHGIMQGRDGNLFAPNAHATRAEAVVVVLTLLQ